VNVGELEWQNSVKKLLTSSSNYLNYKLKLRLHITFNYKLFFLVNKAWQKLEFKKKIKNHVKKLNPYFSLDITPNDNAWPYFKNHTFVLEIQWKSNGKET